MKHLLHIPTGQLITWQYGTKLISFEESFGGRLLHRCAVEEAIESIASGNYFLDFYERNNIPTRTSIAEFEVIDI